MSGFDAIMKSILGRDIGLDRNGNLLLRSSAIILAYDTNPMTLAANAGTPGASLSAALGATQNNLAIANLAGANRLVLTPPGGGAVITGLDSTGIADGAPAKLLVNPSATDQISFAHQSGSSLSANQFSCPGALTVALEPFTCAWLVYVVNKWMFA